MKRRIYWIVLASVLLFTGCGKQKVQSPQETEDSEATEEETEEAAADDENEDEDDKTAEGCVLTVVSHTAQAEERFYFDEEPLPYAYVTYTEFSPSDDFRKDHDALAEVLTALNEENKNASLSTLAEYTDYAREAEQDLMGSFSNECTTEVVRADSAIVSYYDTYFDWCGGAHPNTWYDGGNYDVKEGRGLTVMDVVQLDEYELCDLITQNLVPIAAEEEYEFSEDDDSYMHDIILDEIANETLVWTLDEKNLTCYFSPYELQYYALGPIWSELSLGTYPNLIKEEYKPSAGEEKFDVVYTEADPEDLSMEDLGMYRYDGYAGDEETEEVPTYYVENEDWDIYYLKDGIFDELTEVPFDYKKVGEEKSDWIEAGAWAYEHDITLPSDLYSVGYEDENYYYYGDNRADEGILAVELAEVGYYNIVARYDFSSFLDVPGGNEFTTFYIPYAAAYDNILYVEIAHRTYASDQPYTGFIVAVDMDNGDLLWRSDMQVANGNNFIVGDDVIICGYGFTKEPDYIYFLSRKSGAVLDKIKVNSAPDYFIPEDDSLYVICYNTVYEYNIMDE